MPVKFAAALALIAANTQPFPTGDAVLECLGYLGQQPLFDAVVQQRFGGLVDDPMVDAICAAVFRYAHLVVGADVVDPGSGRHESLTARSKYRDEIATIGCAQYVRDQEHRRVMRHQRGLALRRETIDVGKCLVDLRRWR